MVKLTKIYTRGGDDGLTSLGNGDRASKCDARLAAIGTVDEANSAIGVARLHTPIEFQSALSAIQNDLFDLGADLCVPESENYQYPPLRIIPSQVERLEKEIDAMNQDLAPLNSFILPGGSPGSAYLHLARTIARRAEREMVQLNQSEKINPESIKYINRLSDYLFVLARKTNANGTNDVLWIPGVNRKHP